MNSWIENYFEALFIAFLLTGLIIPKILLIAFRKKLFDGLDERKIHRGAVPRLGGIAFMPAILISVILGIGLNLRFSTGGMPATVGQTSVHMLFLICSLTLLFLVGIADDLIGVRYRAKFLFQIIGGVLVVISGMWVSDLYGFLGIERLPVWLGWALTVLLVVYVTNAINLIDGIDGLASGLSIIALVFYSYVLLATGRYLNAMICGAALGALIPFFYFNVFGRSANHTKIFMGDTGALTIGMILAYMSIVVTTISPTEIPGGENVIVLALAPIMLPCLDVIRVFMHRVKNGHNPFLPDKCHIHHKMLALGFVQWQALIVILAADAVLVIVNLLVSPLIGSTWIILGDILLWTLANMGLTRLIRRREHKQGVILYE